MTQNNNDRINLLNGKSTSTALDIERTAYDQKNNYEKPVNNQINDYSDQSSRYSDLGNAPLPSENDLPTESEINQNKNMY